MDDQGTNRAGTGRLKSPRFSLATVLISMSAIAVGLDGSAWLLGVTEDARFNELAGNVIWFGSGALIGAGLLLPFKRPAIGAMLGAAFYFVLMGVLNWC
jgi:hypothetical protein